MMQYLPTGTDQLPGKRERDRERVGGWVEEKSRRDRGMRRRRG